MIRPRRDLIIFGGLCHCVCERLSHLPERRHDAVVGIVPVAIARHPEICHDANRKQKPGKGPDRRPVRLCMNLKKRSQLSSRSHLHIGNVETQTYTVGLSFNRAIGEADRHLIG